MAGFFRHLSVLFLTAAFAAGNLGVCAGWKPTAEARMACCAKDGVCPMRKAAASERTAAHVVAHVVTQAQADSCCAASEQGNTKESAQASASAAAPAIVLLPVTFPAPDLASPWRPPARPAASPPPLHSVPRHVLLTVFLV